MHEWLFWLLLYCDDWWIISVSTFPGVKKQWGNKLIVIKNRESDKNVSLSIWYLFVVGLKKAKERLLGETPKTAARIYIYIYIVQWSIVTHADTSTSSKRYKYLSKLRITEIHSLCIHMASKCIVKISTICDCSCRSALSSAVTGYSWLRYSLSL